MHGVNLFIYKIRWKQERCLEFHKNRNFLFLLKIQNRHWNITPLGLLQKIVSSLGINPFLNFCLWTAAISILWNTVHRNKTFTLLTFFWHSLNSMFSTNKGKNSSDSHHHRIPVVIMTQQSYNEKGKKYGDCPCKKQPRKLHLLHAHVSYYGQRYRKA